MADVHAIAMSPDKTHLVVKRGNTQYAVIDRREGITKDTRWRDKKALAQMVIKGDYKIFKKPVKYKGVNLEKGRKSVDRLDEGSKSHKNKKEELIINLGLENFKKDLQKADNSHLPKKAERFSYNCSENYNIVYIPVNRLKQVYQTDEALNMSTVNKKMKQMKEGKPMPPVYIGYDYDVHDGHHSWNAAIKAGYTHVPCKVVGSDPDKVKQAIAKYKSVWKSETETNESLNIALVLDLTKGVLNTGKLVKRRVMVRGKNGKIFYRMQWVDPKADDPNLSHPGVDHSTYSHHEEGLKEMEKRQSNRFPVVHHPTHQLRNREHNYVTDKEKYAEAEKKFKNGEKLPPVKINPHGEILDNHHLVDLAKKHGLTHTPVVVVGSPTLKKQLEDKLKDKVVMQDESGEQVDLTSKEDPNRGLSTETVADLEQFNKFTKKKYTKQHIMNEAKRQGIKWSEVTKDGTPLAENSKIMWMRAHQAIEEHIKSGKPFEVTHDEQDVNKRMEQDGKDSIHKHFIKLLEKHGSEDALMEWARKKGIMWKEKRDPQINWMYAVVAIKKELAKGKMLDGVRTRQKKAQEEANLIVSTEVKSMVKALGQRYGKSKVMQRAEELGIEFDKYNKKGEPLADNSNILWMRAHEAIARHIAKGNEFKMGDEQDTGIKAEVGDYGNAKLTKMQSYAVDLAKRKSQNREPKAKKWALKALMIDKGIGQEEAQEIYDKVMERARNARLMVHFDPLEILPSGVTLAEQLSSDGEFKNDYALNRGYDREHREANESDMFGDDYSEAEDSDRPNYGCIDLFNRGLKSHPYNGEVAFVLKDEVKKRSTGSHIDSNNIPYGEEGRWVRSMEDPHHLLIDRWTARWKQPNKADGQRSRAFDAITEGKEYKDDNRFFETHIHGGIKFDRDIDHVLVPSSWKTDDSHKEKHDAVKSLASQFGISIKYE